MATSNLKIVDIEFTQTTQYFNIPTGQGSGYAPDNSLPLVSNKPVIVRVYIDARSNDPSIPVPAQVDGTLLAISTGTGGSGIYDSLTGPIDTRIIGTINRTIFTHTLNFMIPQDVCNGKVLCEIVIFDPSNRSSANGDTQYPTLNFVDLPPVNMHGVLVHYTGPDYFNNPVDATPTSLDVGVVCDYLLRTSPISDFRFDGCEVIPWSDKLAVTANFYALSSKLASMRALSGTDDIYLGVIPPEAGCGGVCGLGGGGSALFFGGTSFENNDAIHEIGHALGRAHAPECLPPGDPGDPNYPHYSIFPRASIGECGVDTRTLNVTDPRVARDYMSYCMPVWQSPYGFNQLFNAVASGKFSFSPITGADAENESDHYFVLFRVYRGDPKIKVTIQNAFHFVRRAPVPVPTIEKGITVELTGSNDSLLYTAACYPVTHTGGTLPFEDFVSYFPNFTELKKIKVLAHNEEVASFEKGSDESQMAKVSKIEMQKTENLLRLTWQGETPKSKTASPDIQYSVRYSHDGRKWRPVAASVSENKVIVNTDLLPGGEQCRFQVLASVGLNTTSMETETFALPLKPRKPFLHSPEVEAEYEYGTPVYFSGTGYSPDFGNCRQDEIIWTSLTGGKLGVGHQVTAARLSVGYHWITLHVSDSMGNMATKSFGVRIVPAKNSSNMAVTLPDAQSLLARKQCNCGH